MSCICAHNYVHIKHVLCPKLNNSKFVEFSQIKWSVPLQELELRRMLWECLQRDHALNNMCNQTNGWARHHGQCDVETRKHKSTFGGTDVSFLSFSKRSECQSYLVLSVHYHSLFFLVWVKTNIAPFWPGRLRSVLIYLLDGSTICPPCSEWWKLWMWPHEGAHLVASGLSTEVVETILQPRAPSTKKLYTLKWKLSLLGAETVSSTQLVQFWSSCRPISPQGLCLCGSHWQSDLTYAHVWWPILGICALQLTHPKCTHTAVNTQPWTHTPEQWAAIYAVVARGAVGGSVPGSRAPQLWYWRWRERCTFTPPT